VSSQPMTKASRLAKMAQQQADEHWLPSPSWATIRMIN